MFLRAVLTISTSHPLIGGILDAMALSEHSDREGAGDRNGAARKEVGP